MFSGRYVSSTLGDETVRAARRCRQERILSPLLWFLLVDNLIGDLGAQELDFQDYANNLIIIVRSKLEVVIQTTGDEATVIY